MKRMTILLTLIVILQIFQSSHSKLQLKETNIFGQQINKAFRCVLGISQVFYDRIKEGTINSKDKNQLISSNETNKSKAREYLNKLDKDQIKGIIEKIKETDPLLEICKSEKLIKEWDEEQNPHIAKCGYATDFLVQIIKNAIDQNLDLSETTIKDIREKIIAHFENCIAKVEELFPKRNRETESRRGQESFEVKLFGSKK